LVIVGPTPPPYGGQTVMLQALIDSKDSVFPDYDWWVVPVRFSQALDQHGKFRLRKVLHLIALVARVAAISLTRRPRILYYTPAGPTTLPVLRDIIVLCILRPLFHVTVFHFHAAGVSETYRRLPRVARPLFRRAYWHADLAIKVSPSAPDDPANLRARVITTIPNGIEDLTAGRRAGPPGKVAQLLFVGLVSESKGLLVLLEALRLLDARDIPFDLQIVGEFESSAFAEVVHDRLAAYGLAERVTHRGVLLGEEKVRAFASSDILCVPTFFESESFGLVAVEAMAFGLPVVATRWRGLVDVVADQETGLLVSPGDSSQLADALAWLIEHPDEGKFMGLRGRDRFEQRFTLERHLKAMRTAFESLAAHPGVSR
jgi:glycosyltransferase involved in cell wall biosynthesis